MGANPELVWLDLVADLIDAGTRSWPAERIALQFVESYRASGCSWHGDPTADERQFAIWPAENFTGCIEEITAWSRRASRSHPVLRYYQTTGQVRAMQVAEVPTVVAEPRVWADWDEWSQEWPDARHQLLIPLRTLSGMPRALVVGRADRFNSTEMSLADRLARVLTGLDRQRDAVAGWSAGATQEARGSAADLRLTPRELAVLHLLGEALTAAAIARRLVISEGTVHKHLERIYVKLGVSDRLGAVLRAQRVGLLPAPLPDQRGRADGRVPGEARGGDEWSGRWRGGLAEAIRSSSHTASPSDPVH